MELPERVGVVTLYEIVPDYEDTYQFIIDQRHGGRELLASLEIEPYVEPLAPELPVITIERYFDRDEIDCMAKNIYFEAKTESIKGQVAVGLVTLNRVLGRHYPDTVCEVVYERKQFSWYSDGLSDRPVQIAAWEKARLIASALLDPDTSITDFTNGSDHYHADYVEPEWRYSMQMVVQIETHIFYRRDTLHAAGSL